MKIFLPLKIQQTRLYHWRLYIISCVLLAGSLSCLFVNTAFFRYASYGFFVITMSLLLHVEAAVRYNTIVVEQYTILLRKGIWSREHASASFDKIIDFRVYQNIGERILGYGTLFVNTASEHDLYLSGVRYPQQVKEMLMALEHKSVQKNQEKIAEKKELQSESHAE